MRQRQTERTETDRVAERGRQTQRQTGRQTDRNRQRGTEMDRETDRQRDTLRDRERRRDREWLRIKRGDRHGAWLYGERRTCAEAAAVSRGTTHVSALAHHFGGYSETPRYKKLVTHDRMRAGLV